MTLKGSSQNKHTAVPAMHWTETSTQPSSPKVIMVSAAVPRFFKVTVRSNELTRSFLHLPLGSKAPSFERWLLCTRTACFFLASCPGLFLRERTVHGSLLYLGDNMEGSLCSKPFSLIKLLNCSRMLLLCGMCSSPDCDEGNLFFFQLRTRRGVAPSV